MQILYPTSLDFPTLTPSVEEKNSLEVKTGVTFDDLLYLIDGLQRKVGIDDSTDTTSLDNRIQVVNSDLSSLSLTVSSVNTNVQALAAQTYVVISASSVLSNERALTGTANQVILTDGGAGGALTLSLPQSIATTSTPTFGGMTLTGGLTLGIGSGTDLSITTDGGATLILNGNVKTGTGGYVYATCLSGDGSGDSTKNVAFKAVGTNVSTSGSYCNLTGFTYASSPGYGSAEFVIYNSSDATKFSRFDLTSWNGTSTWTQRFRILGSNGFAYFRYSVGIGYSLTATSTPALSDGVAVLHFKNGTAPSSFASTTTHLWSSTDGLNIGYSSSNKWVIGEKFGAFNVTAVARVSAYTQTYSTASKTHPNATAATLTDNTGGTADTTLDAVEASYTQATMRNNFADLAAMVNKNTADMLDVKKVVNAIIDDLQSYGLFQ